MKWKVSYLDSEHSLPKKHVSCGSVDVVIAGVTRVDHEAIYELHGLGTLTTQLARDDDLTTTGSRLHDEAENTIARTTYSQTW